MGHYNGCGTTTAAMVHRVFAICKHGCCLLCYKCTNSYIKKGGQIKMGKFPFLRPVAYFVISFVTIWSGQKDTERSNSNCSDTREISGICV